MYETHKKINNTLIIFFPFEIKKFNQYYLFGDFEPFENVTLFFVSKLYDYTTPKKSLGLFTPLSWNGDEGNLKLRKSWVCVKTGHNFLFIKKIKMEGAFIDLNSYHILWINYDFKMFSQCEISSSDSAYSEKSYFKILKEKINEKVNREKIRDVSENYICSLRHRIIFKLYSYSTKIMPLTKYFNIASHINNYLNGFVWVVISLIEKKKFDVKTLNFLMSVILDMFLGIMFLNWLNSKVSLDSSPTIFLLTAESIVNSIKDLITWLRGDPAGLKLNWAFNRVLATFFSFHIDIWWTFIAFLKPSVKIIFQIFIKLGLLGITFQASITADLLALVSFHVYCIYAYAAKLYSIQLSSLNSLWRLFFGRKKNPLRGKVDSCIYSPEQLFVGTLGFTILLFLFPTTLLYYVVFTCIRLVILAIGAMLMLIMYLNQTIPVYSTILWIIKSPKVAAGVEIVLDDNHLKSNFKLLNVKPVNYSWWETIQYFIPDCVPRPTEVKYSDLLSCIMSGKLIYPM